MDVTLAGKVAIVTGASRGIGKAIAGTLAAGGADVMLVSRKIEALRAAQADIAREIEEAGGSGPHGRRGEVEVFAANVGDTAAATECVRATIERFGRLDVLVNNAATNPYYGPTLGISESQYDKTFSTNVRAPLFCTKAAWEQAFEREPGVVVNIASVGGLRAGGALGIYGTTKAALIHLTKQLAGELGPTRVVAVAPGLVDTDFAAVLVDSYGESIAAALPTKRIGVPQDVANLVAFVASDRASWITGETFVVDGGSGVAPRR